MIVSPRPSLQNIYATKLNIRRSPKEAPIPIPTFAPVLKTLLPSVVLVAVGAESVVLGIATVGDSLVQSVELVVVLVSEGEVAAIKPPLSVPSRAVDASIAVTTFVVDGAKVDTLHGPSDVTTERIELDMSVDADDSSVRVVTLSS